MGGWRRNLSLRLAFRAREGVGRDGVDTSCTEVAVDVSRRKGGSGDGWRRNLPLRLAFRAREGVGHDGVDASCAEVAVVSSTRHVVRLRKTKGTCRLQNKSQ